MSEGSKENEGCSSFSVITAALDDGAELDEAWAVTLGVALGVGVPLGEGDAVGVGDTVGVGVGVGRDCAQYATASAGKC